MPRDDWKTVAIRSDLYDRLTILSDELERPINWTANRAIEYVIRQCIHTYGDNDSKPPSFDPQTAEEMGLR